MSLAYFLMEVLRPAEQTSEIIQESSRTDIPKELLDAGINLKNVEFLNHLGLKYEMFNEKVMEKIDFIASKVEDLRSLQDVDMRLGDDGSMPRIDKIYSYLKLKDQADRIREEERVISERIGQYERS